MFKRSDRRESCCAAGFGDAALLFENLMSEQDRKIL
jgi:hypothetical protein